MSWYIGAIELPFAPGRVIVKPVQNVKAVSVATQMPWLLPFGPKTRVVTLEGYISHPTKTVTQIEDDYLKPLMAMSEKRLTWHIIVVDDGGAAFWTLVAGSESDDTIDYVKGNNSYKVILSAQTLNAYHDYAANEDLEHQDVVTIWIKGANSGTTLRVRYWNEVYASKTNGYLYEITDNFTTWTRFVIRKDQFSNAASPTGWGNIRCVHLESSSSISATLRFDRMVVGVGHLVDAPGTRYDGIYVVQSFPFEERGGIVKAWKYKLLLWYEDDMF